MNGDIAIGAAINFDWLAYIVAPTTHQLDSEANKGAGQNGQDVGDRGLIQGLFNRSAQLADGSLLLKGLSFFSLHGDCSFNTCFGRANWLRTKKVMRPDVALLAHDSRLFSPIHHHYAITLEHVKNLALPQLRVEAVLAQGFQLHTVFRKEQGVAVVHRFYP